MKGNGYNEIHPVSWDDFGTGGGTRTPKVLPPADFESAASTSSATPAIERWHSNGNWGQVVEL